MKIGFDPESNHREELRVAKENSSKTFVRVDHAIPRGFIPQGGVVVLADFCRRAMYKLYPWDNHLYIFIFAYAVHVLALLCLHVSVYTRKEGTTLYKVQTCLYFSASLSDLHNQSLEAIE